VQAAWPLGGDCVSSKNRPPTSNDLSAAWSRVRCFWRPGVPGQAIARLRGDRPAGAERFGRPLAIWLGPERTPVN